jgi:hypothetical protein
LFGSAFGILADYHDRSFRDGRERYDENLLQRPARASAGILHPLSARTRVRVAYEFDYTRLGPAGSTHPAFRVPENSVVDGVRASIEAERGVWRATGWWNPARRRHWGQWGWDACGAACETATRNTRAFQRYGVSLARPVVLSPRWVGRIETSWMSGADLDRFSQYAVDGFANRLQGYPTASVRYDRGALAKSAIAWQTPFGGRLDGFIDGALVADSGYGRHIRGLLGIGGAVELPMPAAALLSIEWGYGVHAPRRDGGQGTHVVRISGHKVF